MIFVVLVSFISMFIFGIELKEFLNTIELIYLTLYNYLTEFKLDTYSTFYKNFNPNSFNDLIKDIRNYVNNSSFRVKQKILNSFDLESSQKEESNLLTSPQKEVNDKFVDFKTEESKPQINDSSVATTVVDKGTFRDKYKLTLIDNYIKVNVWDIIYSPYFYVPVTITTVYLGYSFSNYWLPIFPFIFSFFSGDKPSDGNFGDLTPKAPQDNDIDPTPKNSPQLFRQDPLETYEFPSITITSPTDSTASTVSNTSTELPKYSPISSISNSPSNSPTRTFSSNTFNT
jgi:hypothetical protein